MKLPVDYNQLTQSQRRQVRELYCKLQDWRCSHCGNNLMEGATKEIMAMPINYRLFPGGIGFLKFPIHLHHDHRTGLTIGAVHSRCNAVLWQYHGE